MENAIIAFSNVHNRFDCLVYFCCLQDALNDTLQEPTARDRVLLLRSNISITNTSGWVPPNGKLLSQRMMFMGESNKEPVLGLAYKRSLLQLPANAKGNHLQVRDAAISCLAQGPHAHKRGADINTPDVWTMLLWGVNRWAPGQRSTPGGCEWLLSALIKHMDATSHFA